MDLDIIGQGMTTKVYRDGDTAIKLYADVPPYEAFNEARNQQIVFDKGLPVPAVRGVKRFGENMTALYMDYIKAIPVYSKDMSYDELVKVIDIAIKLQRQIHLTKVNTLQKIYDRYKRKIESTRYLDLEQKREIIALLDELDDDSNNLCHGDFHLLNILYDGTKYWVIDWVDAAQGNILADLCRSVIIIEGEGEFDYAKLYLDRYCKEYEIDKNDVLKWKPIVAAGRLDDGVTEKVKMWLLSIIRENIK